MRHQRTASRRPVAPGAALAGRPQDGFGTVLIVTIIIDCSSELRPLRAFAAQPTNHVFRREPGDRGCPLVFVRRRADHMRRDTSPSGEIHQRAGLLRQRRRHVENVCAPRGYGAAGNIAQRRQAELVRAPSDFQRSRCADRGLHSVEESASSTSPHASAVSSRSSDSAAAGTDVAHTHGTPCRRAVTDMYAVRQEGATEAKLTASAAAVIALRGRQAYTGKGDLQAVLYKVTLDKTLSMFEVSRTHLRASGPTGCSLVTSMTLKIQREHGWKIDAQRSREGTPDGARSTPTSQADAQPTGHSNGAAAATEAAAAGGGGDGGEAQQQQRPKANSISLRRTDDRAGMHLGHKMEHMYNHLVGYLGWSKAAAKEHLGEQAFEQIDTNIDWSELHDTRHFKSGVSSEVFVAHWSGKRVVVKAARGRVGDAGDAGASARQLASELRTLAQLHHPNTVRLLGAGHTPEGRLFLLLEHLSGGILGGGVVAGEEAAARSRSGSSAAADATCDDALSSSALSLFGAMRRRRAAASLAEAVERALQRSGAAALRDAAQGGALRGSRQRCRSSAAAARGARTAAAVHGFSGGGAGRRQRRRRRRSRTGCASCSSRAPLQVAQGLEYLQLKALPGASVLHRDIRPDNLGLDSEGIVKLLDFGSARILDAGDSITEAFPMTSELGSMRAHKQLPLCFALRRRCCRRRYLAPEVVTNQPYTASSDIYSLGMVMWELASNAPPFPRLSNVAFHQRITVLGERPLIEPSWPPPFAEAIRRAWAHEPRDRASVQEIEALLLQALVQLETKPHKGGARLDEAVESAAASLILDGSTHTGATITPARDAAHFSS
ncbi:kinase-like domain-containing protein [Tribonema minus]|uniref:Kinase-like domain-containing protein n=1 Tax=Tribonema minus TaxID=303371 RepID=A0A835ZHA9_9STRA|nr:kinase-like domain-containing protein [Tribonema minus]